MQLSKQPLAAYAKTSAHLSGNFASQVGDEGLEAHDPRIAQANSGPRWNNSRTAAAIDRSFCGGAASLLHSGPFYKHVPQTDNGIAQHVDLALRVLRDAISVRTSDSSNPFEDYRADRASLSNARAAAASGVKQLYLMLDDRYASLPAVAEL